MDNMDFNVEAVAKVIKDLGFEDSVDAKEMTKTLDVFYNCDDWNDVSLPDKVQIVPAMPHTIMFDRNGFLYRVIQYASFLNKGEVVSFPVGTFHLSEGITTFSYRRYVYSFGRRTVFTDFIERDEAIFYCILPIICGCADEHCDFYSFKQMLDLYGVKIVDDDMRTC